jgi:hypothetical protein
MPDITLPGQPADIPLPPELCETLGYAYSSRFVGFFWSSLGDQLIVTDGPNSSSGNSWAFMSFKRHRAVAPLLAPFDFGSSEHEGLHMLVIDREANRASVAPVAEARAFLAEHGPKPPELTPEQQILFERELDRVLELWRTAPIDPDAIAKDMLKQRGRIGRVMSFLDMCPVPPENGQTP